MTDKDRFGMEEARIRIFLDDAHDPIADHEPPAAVTVDTRRLADGQHQLRIEAHDRSGNVGLREVPFQVRNGPGITLTGLRPGAVVRDTINFTVNAFSAEDPFEPRWAESPSPIPVWLWVLSMVIVAWATWYVAVQWKPPPEFSKTATYAAPMSDQHQSRDPDAATD